MQTPHSKFWHEALTRYATKDWVDKPTIFAEQITSYLPKGATLLELGAGQGQDSRYFARLGFRVTATDLIDTGLNTARQKAEKEGLAIDFRTLDLANPLPFPDNSFNIVYSHLGLHYFGEVQTITLFKEIHRVLNPKGMLVTLFNTVDDPEIHSGGFEKLEDNFYHEIATGLNKRYFSVEDTQRFISGLFTPLLLDDKGETYKDTIKTLIRLVGRKM